MRVYVLHRRQKIKAPLKRVFEFFQSPENLERITPRSVGFRILTPKPITMQVGTVLDYTIRLFGLPVRWTTLISEYDPPQRFADVALKGPYRFWHHTHTFEVDGDATVMTDEVNYALPFGWLGRLAHALWVKRQLQNIFDYRGKVIATVMGTGESHTSTNAAPSEPLAGPAS